MIKMKSQCGPWSAGRKIPLDTGLTLGRPAAMAVAPRSARMRQNETGYDIYA